jgi:phosphoribosylanthranilate isomerase
VSVAVKICGLGSAEGVSAAIAGGARYVGFVFYPRSPRNIAPEAAGALARIGPAALKRVGVFVDPADDEVARVLAVVSLDFLQLHGEESPARVAALKERTGRRIIKAIKVASDADLGLAANYFGIADLLLIDAKPPAGLPGALPGGNAQAFDWTILARHPLPSGAPPWLLSGGLSVDNVGEAVKISGARAVDVSSGVEDAPGQKNPAKIRAFLDAARALGPADGVP